jgi:transcription initiation factor TFIID TATA-box-binding protein
VTGNGNLCHNKEAYGLAVVKVDQATSLQIRNVITTADLGNPVDATRGRYDLSDNYGNVGYVKDNKMQGRVAIFISGKIISTGAKSVAQSVRDLKRTRYLLSTTRFIRSKKLKPKVRNIVATVDIHERLDVAELSQKLPKILYEPEQFPSAIYKTNEGPTCLLFASGKIVIAGANSEAQLEQVAKTLRMRLNQFKQSYS